MKLIGLSGKLGSGKNYIAENIIAPHFKDKYNKFNKYELFAYFFYVMMFQI
jgi:dephospho-CoA kinase